jgi:hypothetical protein
VGEVRGDLDLHAGRCGRRSSSGIGITRRRDGMCRAPSPSIRGRIYMAFSSVGYGTKKTARGAVFQPGRQQAAGPDNVGHRGHCD